MNRKVIVIGAGMGGLTAALRLAQLGYEVDVLEAQAGGGGLAARFECERLTFDSGPYVLLDRPGLDWAFEQLGQSLSDHVTLKRIEEVYEVTCDGEPPIRFYDSLERTIDELDQNWPGSGIRYRRFIEQTSKTYERLQPLQRLGRPGVGKVLTTGAWRELPFLLKPLQNILARTGLPEPVARAIGIWTHVAGQTHMEAPSPLALVPSVIHRIGAYYAVDSIGTIPETLCQSAEKAGVAFHYGTRVRSIACENGRVTGVTLDGDELMRADVVVSNYSGIGTHVELCDPPAGPTERWERLPLQSPGVCAYLATKARIGPPYLRFRLPPDGQRCRLLVTPTVMQNDLEVDGWRPARLIAPMEYASAQRGGAEKQQEYLDEVLGEPWWREVVGEHRVVSTRLPADWGREHNLYRDSMNPVMTARFMRSGRIASQSSRARSVSGGQFHAPRSMGQLLCDIWNLGGERDL